MESALIIRMVFWSMASTALLIFMFISLVSYRSNKEKTYLYYSLYCFFIWLYLVLHRLGYFSDAPWRLSVFWASLLWFLQIIYLNIYLLFGMHFLGMTERYPNVMKWLRVLRYGSISLAIFLIAIELVFRQYRFKLLEPVFIYGIVPVTLALSLYIMLLAVRSHYKLKYFFLIGSGLYIVLSIIALVLSEKKILTLPVEPITYFYFAVIIECSLFSYGLGIRIKEMYRHKLLIQSELKKSKEILQQKLEKEITDQQQYIYLLKELHKKQQLETEVAVLQTNVLRSQMNSHFIFNVLNSIKSYIIHNDQRNAVLYLNNFARFIRKILDGSIYEHSNLESELETIELYIHIENMRFNEPITFNIKVDEEVDPKLYSFPALLLQPFVENAIWHGLMPKKEQRILDITVSRFNEHTCQIIIEDNGIGRVQSELKKSGMVSKKSHGLNIVDNRIAIFNRENPQQISYAISDLAMGTKVVIKIETLTGKESGVDD